MAKDKFILKLKVDMEKSENSDTIIRVAKIKTEECDEKIIDAGSVVDILGYAINPISSKEAVKILMCESMLENLNLLIEKKFVIKIFETGNGFKLIISKDNCSTTFEASKEEGIVTALVSAEEWAEEMLIQLKGVKVTV